MAASGTFIPDDSPPVELLPDGRSVRLLADFIYRDSGGREWVAKEGLESDGATIPRLLWRFVGGPLTGKYRNAALIHDAYCNEPRGYTQAEIDAVFYRIMRDSNVRVTKAYAMWAGVRLYQTVIRLFRRRRR